MLNWCIIGTGDVVQRLVQNSFFIKNKSKVSRLMSYDKISMEKFAKKYKIKKFSNKLIDIINDKEINSLYIATHPNSHYYYINKLSPYIKFILCEKPLVIKKNELQNILKICNKYKTSLYTCFYRRHLKRFKFIKNIIEQNKLGKVLFFKMSLIHTVLSHPTAGFNPKNNKNIPWRFNKKISGGGNFLDMGIHMIDMIDYLLGEIKSVTPIKKNFLNYYKVEDTASLQFKLRNGIIGNGFWCSVADTDEDSFEIYGDKGTIKFSMNKKNKISISIGSSNLIKYISFEKPFHSNMIRYVVNEFTKLKKQNRYKIYNEGIKASNIYFS